MLIFSDKDRDAESISSIDSLTANVKGSPDQSQEFTQTMNEPPLLQSKADKDRSWKRNSTKFSPEIDNSVIQSSFIDAESNVSEQTNKSLEITAQTHEVSIYCLRIKTLN